MEFLHAAIALLASIVLVLAGMVGWLYWQQQRMFQSQANITMVIGEIARSLAPPPQAIEEEEAGVPTVEAEEVKLPEPEAEASPAEPVVEEEDDRVSVEQGPEVVDTVLDTDSLDSKTKKELQDILTKRGIPFGKGDNKGVLVSLLKATA
jgi:hypothetical protein